MEQQPQFYTRVRGRISGPFDVATLQKMVRRGGLSRIHEVSGDQKSWAAAGEYEDLFPRAAFVAQGGGDAASEPSEDDSILVTTEPADNSASPSPSGPALFFYTQRGSTVGPVPMAVLRVLVENGTIARSDLVWRENSETGAPAGQVPALAPLFGMRSRASGGSSGPGTADGNASKLADAGRLSHVVGVWAASIILVLLNLPWAVLDRHPIWWWQVFRGADNEMWPILATFVLTTAVTICFVGPFTKGLSRGVVYVGSVGIVFMIFCVALASTGAGPEATGYFVIPVTIALLLGVCSFRRSSPSSVPGRVWLALCSVLVALGSMALIIDVVVHQPRLNGLPGGVMFSAILAFFSTLAGLVAGITGLVGLKEEFSESLNLVTLMTGGLALVLPIIAVLTVIVTAGRTLFPNGDDGWSSQWNDQRQLLLTVSARLLTVGLALLAILAVGMRELLTAGEVS